MPDFIHRICACLSDQLAVDNLLVKVYNMPDFPPPLENITFNCGHDFFITCAFGAASPYLLCCSGAHIGHGVVSMEPSHPSALTLLQSVLLFIWQFRTHSAHQCCYPYHWLLYSPLVICFGDWHSTVAAQRALLCCTGRGVASVSFGAGSSAGQG